MNRLLLFLAWMIPLCLLLAPLGLVSYLFAGRTGMFIICFLVTLAWMVIASLMLVGARRTITGAGGCHPRRQDLEAARLWFNIPVGQKCYDCGLPIAVGTAMVTVPCENALGGTIHLHPSCYRRAASANGVQITNLPAVDLRAKEYPHDGSL